MTKTRARQGAEIMLNKGWFTTNKLAKEMNVSNLIATQTIQSIRNSKSYDYKMKKVGRIIHIQVTGIKPLPKKPFEKPMFSERTLKMRAVIFGTPVPAL